MSLTRTDVEKVAALARLTLSESEAEAMTRDMGAILGYIDQLGEVATDDVEPMAHPIGLHTVLREDEVTETLPREAALGNAPRASGEGYLVPAVLGD